MHLAIDIFKVILPFLYLATVLSYGYAFFTESRRAKEIKTPLLSLTILIHFSYLVGRTILLQHPPITTIFEILSLVAFSIALAYWVIEFRTGIKNTGFFILTLALIFQTISTVFIGEFLDVPPVLRSNLLGVHVTSAMLGIAAFAISGVYGLLYLMLYHDLKSGQFGVIYNRLPDLEKLEKMTIHAVASGFLLLTLAILFGMTWFSQAFDNPSYLDPKLIGTMLIWVLYGTGLIARRLLGWQGRKMMFLSIAGFLFSLFSLTIINIYFSSFHRFY